MKLNDQNAACYYLEQLVSLRVRTFSFVRNVHLIRVSLKLVNFKHKLILGQIFLSRNMQLMNFSSPSLGDLATNLISKQITTLKVWVLA